MEILELARELGKAIQAQECFKKIEQAKKANDEDAALQDKIGQFNLIRMSLDQALSADTHDDQKIQDLNNQLKAVYEEVMQNPSMQAYNAAHGELESLMQKINTIINGAANGEDPLTIDLEGCTGSCATCSGCH